MELHKHKAQAPLLLLAENLGRGQSALCKVQHRNLLPDRFSIKYREIFQVYNNFVYTIIVMKQGHIPRVSGGELEGN